MEDQPITKTAAQQRANRIRAFRSELERVERDGALTLSPEQRRGLGAYHDGILHELETTFDVDTSETQQQMSWGMRIVSTLGAAALTAAVYFFFYRYWGTMSTTLQVLVVVAAPVLALLGAQWCSRREKTLYFTGLLASLAVGGFVLNLMVLGAVFNITPTENSLLVWGAFALILAYAYGLRLPLLFGLVSLIAWITAALGSWSGVYWVHLGERPENYMTAGLVVALVPLISHHRLLDRFPQVYRLVGLVAVFVGLLVLSNWGGGSHLSLTPDAVEILYQVAGFVVAGIVIWIGVRRGWLETAVLGSIFFVVFLYIKFFDWWWELMPRYLFFLVLGLVAVALLLILRWARSLMREVAS